jgi:hypothetical protein
MLAMRAAAVRLGSEDRRRSNCVCLRKVCM